MNLSWDIIPIISHGINWCNMKEWVDIIETNGIIKFILF